VATAIILIDLILITEFKRRYIVPSRFCTIELSFTNKKTSTKEIYDSIKELPLTVLSKHIKENKHDVQLKIISKIRKDEDIFAIKNAIKALTDVQKISISESVKT